MSPYRSGKTGTNRARVLRLSEPVSIANALLVGAVFFGPLPWAFADGVCVACLFAVPGALAAALVLAFRHRAWVVFMPHEERVRVVRTWGWSYSASTLSLAESTNVECSPLGNTMWLFIVEKSGRCARVLPVTSTHAVARLQAALDDALRA